jgi:hypothetical protein
MTKKLKIVVLFFGWAITQSALGSGPAMGPGPYPNAEPQCLPCGHVN